MAHEAPQERVRIERLSQWKAHVGRDLGTSGWMTVDQSRIACFADATEDRQWIHVDPARAAEGPYGATVAHGFLTLALLTHLVTEALDLADGATGINYGLDRVRFPAPVRAGSRIRAQVKLDGCEDVKDGLQLKLAVTIECEGEPKPACVAEWLMRRIEP